MNLDFLMKLNQFINAQNLASSTLNKPLTSVIGLLLAGESMSIMAMPGGAQTVYMDGSRDKAYQVQVNVKTKDQGIAMSALNIIAKKLENLESLPSGNGSYDFQQITITSNPSFLQQDEKGFFIWVLSISAELTIEKGVVD